MSKTQHFILSGEPIKLKELWKWLENRALITISPEVLPRMSASRKVVENCLKDGLPHYGINTGFGNLANTRIPDDKLESLQYNLIKSHACGVGELLSGDIVRTMMLLRANVLAMGYSGVRYELLEYLVGYINEGNIPKIPSQGSVGASGDLAPLAHLALALVEHGLQLKPKEGIALINGTQASLAVAVTALRDASALIEHANMAGALTIEGLRGSAAPFDERIASVRPFQGHAQVSKIIGEYIKNSKIIASHKNCSRVQDPYSLRCIPQVHGAVTDAYDYVSGILENELASCTDNPLVFAGKGTVPLLNGDCPLFEVVSAGNFHGQSISLTCDHLSAAITALGNVSERRIEQMINPKQGELPVKYLVKDSGVNSGFMVAHVAASSLASENKTLAHPASVDSITTSGGQEDFVSMSMWSARKLQQIIFNTQKIIAIELLAAVQAIDMQAEKFEMGVGTQKIYNAIRKHIPVVENDREMYKDIEKMIEMMKLLSLRAAEGGVAIP